jgi:hypothetical protein
MSTFSQTSNEPKKLFLNLLINLDFQVANALYILHNYDVAINGMAEILSLTCSIERQETQEISAKIMAYTEAGSGPESDLRHQYNELQKYLNKYWFSEMQLGMIPTSTLPTQATKPTNTPINPNQSSRL